MKTKTINLYTFNELSDSAKERARDWWRKAFSGDNFWAEYTEEEARQQANFMGFNVEKILWSGFASQGDGACFIGRWNAQDLTTNEVANGWGECDSTTEIKAIAAKFAKLAEQFPELQVKISHRDRYCHERSVDYDCHFFDLETGEEKDWPDNFFEIDFKEACVDLFQWIYRQLEKEYEYQNSAECIDELLVSNGYTFTEDGRRED